MTTIMNEVGSSNSNDGDGSGGNGNGNINGNLIIYSTNYYRKNDVIMVMVMVIDAIQTIPSEAY